MSTTSALPISAVTSSASDTATIHAPSAPHADQASHGSSFERMDRELRAREDRRYRGLVREIRGSVTRASDLSLSTLARLSDAQMEHGRRLAVITQAVEQRAMMDD